MTYADEMADYTIDELREENERLQAEIDRLKIWSSDSHVTELEAENERLRAENGWRLKQINAVLKTNNMLATKYEQYQEDIRVFKLELGDLEDTNERLRAEIEKQKIAYNELSKALVRAQKAVR